MQIAFFFKFNIYKPLAALRAMGLAERLAEFGEGSWQILNNSLSQGWGGEVESAKICESGMECLWLSGARTGQVRKVENNLEFIWG